MLQKIFDMPIYVTNAEGNQFQDIQKEFQYVYDDLLKNNTFGNNPIWDSSTSMLSNKGEFDQELFEQYNVQSFISFISRHIRNYLEQVNFQYDKSNLTMKFHGSWMTLTKKDKHTILHDHGCTDISAVYYFKTNGMDGDLVFNQPNKLLKNSRVFGRYNHHYTIKPKVGQLVIFPSSLDHRVLENKTDNDRVSVSFNMSINFYA